MKHLLALILTLCCWHSVMAGKKAEPVVVAYVTSWTQVVPDPTVMTHLNYAFGHVNEQFNGVRIDNEQRLRSLVSLKEQQPGLRVMLSIGGWGSGRFSEMAASDENRRAFAADCRRVCNEFGLDGIDIDWEYPTQTSAGISASPQDTENFTLLMRDLRQALGKNLWLTLASVGSAQYIDFRSCVQYLDMVNVMAYDMGSAPKHHAALYRSKHVGWLCASECVEAHRKAGVPDGKIVLGMPFYGRGKSGQYMKYADFNKQKLKNKWDNVGKAPYLADEKGELAMGYESPRSIAEKCTYIKKQGLRGAMYWEYADDNELGDLRRAVWQGILQNDKDKSNATQKAVKRLVSVLSENQKREDITPDSFFYDWRNLKAEMLAEKDPTAQAIYRAAMGHLLAGNAWRSQRYDSKTKSHPDSIQEWTHEEYKKRAANLYAQAMQDVEALHAIKLSDAKPLTEEGKDDGIFGGDLLHVVWQAYLQDIPSSETKGFVPSYGDIIEVYRRHNLREATLQLRLDSLDEKNGEDKEEILLRLRDEYADLPICSQVYMQLASLSGKTPQEQYDLLEEALRRYPKSREADEIKNRLLLLRQPRLSGRFHEMFYPDKDYDIPLQIRNMQTASLAVYRVPSDFVFSDKETAGTQFEQLLRGGTLVETLPIDVTNADYLEIKHDTLRWHSPGFGRYALVLDGTTKEKLESKPEPQIFLASVSALTFMSANMSDSKVRIMVTDAMSGEPQQGVKVSFYHRDRDAWDDYTMLGESTTDSRGITEVSHEKNKSIYVSLTRGEDRAVEKKSLGWFFNPKYNNNITHHKHLYTDRSIYRPGQIVYVGGIAYTQSHDQAPQAEPRAEFDLTLFDANGQEVVKHTLKTDEFGTIQDSLQLPESGLPGRYTISCSDRQITIRVEEYRRPTFQVEMDEAPAISIPVDSITLTGRALTYSRWPVSNARVTGSYHWQQSWWYKRFSSGETHNIDTLYTDEEGRFSIRVPVSKELSEEDLRWGQTLILSVDVLSAEGETQRGSSRVTLCSTPLRMRGDVPEQENRESLIPWRFGLYASNDKPVQGDVLCMLSQNGKEVRNFIVPANRDTIPELLRTLPSGQYDLVAKADVKGDTASFRASFTVFSITDTRLQGKHDLWLYTPCDTTSAERPARFQVGTTLPEAWIYCIMNGENGPVRDTLLHLSDQAMLVEVPYEERFLHHLTVTLMLMKDGQVQSERIDFKLEQPDTRLRMHWDTFRDHLQPGQKETWKLTLTRPDGTPASANVMVGLYDASLDALTSYSMNLGISRSCERTLYLRPHQFDGFVAYHYRELGLPLHFLSYEDYSFARWNDEYFLSTRPTRGGKSVRLKSLGKAARVFNMVAPPTSAAREYAGAVQKFDIADLEGLEFESVDQALNGQIAGLDVVQSTADMGDSKSVMRLRGYSTLEEAEEETETLEDAYVRSNLSELAFFYPQLRTDSNGQTSIDFTLPEGLTSWHLHGLAHTKDMMTTTWQETIVAQKELMAELNLPRFLRNGDEATLTASIRNASEKRLKGEAVMDVFDAESPSSHRRSIKRMKVQFDLEPGKEAVYHMPITATLDHPVLSVQWIAKAQDSSDGEVRYLPVLSDMQNVIETKTYMLKGDTTLTMDLSKLFANGNPKAVNKTLTVEHVAEPVFLALQALPSLTAPTRNDILSVASAYYGGSVAFYLAHKYEGLRTAIERWAKEEDSQALESPLVKNQQLADILLNETPWMLEAKQQKASRQRLVTLFDEMEQEQRRMTMLSALSARQQSDGSFAWFPGMRGSVWMTTEVASLLVRLSVITGGLPVPEREILSKAMTFLEKEMHKEVEALRKAKKPMLSLSELRYLYIYIMYKDNGQQTTDIRYLLSLLKKQAEDLDREPRALAAIVLQRMGDEKLAQALMPRIHELLRHGDGMYLAYPGGSFVSIDRKVETHVNLMEAVRTVEPKETDLLAKMAEWLILQKRTQEWERPIQSADAIYALLQTPRSLSGGVWSGKVTYDNQTRKLQKPEADCGYVRERIELPIKGSGGSTKELRIEQKGGEVSPIGGNRGGLGFSWGAVYAQYQMPASEVENHREGMTIRRDVESKSTLREGDRVHIRYTITADRDYEYVCLRAPRPAAAEPAQQLSGYHWQGGIGYYMAMHDASTEYFMDQLPRGTYVIEEDWLISRDGNFLLPPARLICLYAPEYQAQTAGEKFEIK